MNTGKIKTRLLSILGTRTMCYVQGVRFTYLLKVRPKPDPEVKLLDRFLGAGDVSVDVGANGANWTSYMAQRSGPRGCVFAFEADPYYSKATGIAVKLLRLKGVRFFPFGLSDKNECVVMRVTNEKGVRYAGRSFVDRNADPGEEGVDPVELKSLDSMTDEYPELLRTKVFKCDVEGFELYVFRGGRRVIDEARPLVILEAGDHMKGYSAEELHSFFSERGYVSLTMTREGRLAPTDESFAAEGAINVNRVMVPNEKLEVVNDLLTEPARDIS
jgi:FkbM family methyltransferase